jgi:hypothetical protein
MAKSKTDKKITTNLFSGTPEIAIKAILQIKETGNKYYLPALFELLVSNTDTEVENEALKLLGNVKEKDTVPVFVEALHTDRFKKIRKEIITACWQNGLDFSDYLEDFVDLAINENWETAFEALTVIENFHQFPETEKSVRIVSKIKKALPGADESKMYFLNEILRFLE